MRPPVMFRSALRLATAAVAIVPWSQLRTQQTHPPAQLQQSEKGPRQFWGAIGLSGGQAALTCHFCTAQLRTSYAGLLSFGMRVHGRTLVGFELQGWRYDNSETTQRVYAGGPVIQFYPWSAPIFFKAGLGAASFASYNGDDKLSNLSMAGHIGTGIDIRMTPKYVLSPYLSALNGVEGSMRLNDQMVTRSSGVVLLQYGLAISLR